MSQGNRKEDESNEAGPSARSSTSPRYNLRRRVVDDSGDDSDSEMDYGRLGERIHQPNVNVLWNYGAVKLESNPLHYNPLVEVKPEPVSHENGDANEDKEEQAQSKKSSAKKSKKRKRKGAKTEEVLKELLDSQMVILNANLFSIETLASKIPSRQKLVPFIQKVIEDLAEINSTGNTDSGKIHEHETAESEIHQQKGEQEPSGQQSTSDAENQERLTTEPLTDESPNLQSSSEKPPVNNSPPVKKARTDLNSMLNQKDEKAENVLLFDYDKLLSIPFHFHLDFELSTGKDQNATLQTLRDRVSRMATISNISINSHSDVNLLEKLKIFGENIQSIKIGLWNKDDFPHSLEKIVKQCPNLNFLEVTTPRFARPGELCNHSESNKLNSLNYSQNRELSNYTISKVHFKVSCYSCAISSFENFAKSGIRVKDLKIYYGYGIIERGTGITEATEKILETSQGTLRRLTFQNNRDFDGLKIPVMPNLNTLNLVFCCLYRNDLSFQFSEHLPKLKTVYLDDIGLYYYNPMDASFGLAAPAPSVKLLHVKSTLQLTGSYDEILQVFSGIEELLIPYGPHVFCNFKYSKKLKQLTLSVGDLRYHDRAMGILVNLTGVNLEAVKKLWNSSTNFDSHQINPLGFSIVELEDLEKICIKTTWHGTSMLKFLSVFKTLAWKFMQKLQVVNFEHENGKLIRSFKINEF